MERKRFGIYVTILKKPENEEEKKEYVTESFSKLLDKIYKEGIVPDWNSMKLIINESNFDVFGGPDWYEEEKEDYEGPCMGWRMTIAIKFESEQYQGLLEKEN